MDKFGMILEEFYGIRVSWHWQHQMRRSCASSNGFVAIQNTGQSTSFRTSSSKVTWLLPSFDKRPKLVDLDITEETMLKWPVTQCSRSGRDILGNNCIMAVEVWNLQPTASECNCTNGNVAVKWQSSLGSVPCFDDWQSHCTWQTSKSSSHHHWSSIATTHC